MSNKMILFSAMGLAAVLLISRKNSAKPNLAFDPWGVVTGPNGEGFTSWQLPQ